MIAAIACTGSSAGQIVPGLTPLEAGQLPMDFEQRMKREAEDDSDTPNAINLPRMREMPAFRKVQGTKGGDHTSRPLTFHEDHGGRA
ncbi:hypothetical protein [Peteryoungia ipomoeae]|uniref:Uncharacterized protein n=1 Tax=Peteryoungia ipomoeae TaxID=1210932 RepID=A0A4V4HMP9_9HYPH|nr:hypothetical protein [Peteryoungia ipomoeae]THV22946.1 hypothetical protein FAA97_09935 [Peteryoungia ipomoeae]